MNIFFNRSSLVEGLITFALGTILVLMSTLDDVSPNSSLMIFVVFLVVFSNFLYRYLMGSQKNHAGFYYIIFVVLFILLDFFLNVFMFGSAAPISGYPRPTSSVFYLACGFLIIHVSIIMLIPSFHFETKNKKFTLDKIKVNWWLVMILAILAIYPFAKGGADLMFKIIFAARSGVDVEYLSVQGGGTTIEYFMLNISVALSICLIYFIFFNETSKFEKTILILLLIPMFILSVSSGTRTKLMFVVFPPLMFYLYRIIIDKKSLLNVFKVLVVCIIIFLASKVMVDTRGGGWIQDTKSHSVTESYEKQEFELMKGADVGRELFLIFELIDKPILCENELQCFVITPFEVIYKFMVNPIPRAIYKSKYIDPSYLYYNKLRTGGDGFGGNGLNITPTPIGRYFILGGVSGIIWISVIMGSVACFLNYLIASRENKSSVYTCFVFVTYLTISIRDFGPVWIYIPVFVFIMMKLFNVIRKP